MDNFQNCTLLASARRRISLDKEGTSPLLEKYRQMLHDILYGETDCQQAERVLQENLFVFREAAAL